MNNGNPAAPSVEQLKAATNVTPLWNEGIVDSSVVLLHLLIV